jgi:hypothetical protein
LGTKGEHAKKKKKKPQKRWGESTILRSVKSKDRPERKICRTWCEFQVGYGFWYIAAAAS